ncbi:hypothetical protein [Alicyclobacillus sp. ALC3]|uniref:hypothetical protein n=1 Tax=Alicyclobacillus sp. ALC3 TaxID=2796143 RepID=UPI002379A258|nr:hypothetical protein [Alicyclobacillus sp. ALC3]WDL97895.1 DUF2325 domain-containing protein [Alicyclobacillus sp. ALC3]
MESSHVLPVPVSFRYHDVSIRSSAEEPGIYPVELTVEDLWSYMNESGFIHDEDAIVLCSFDDLRKLNGFYTLRILYNSLTPKQFIERLQVLGVHFTPKDYRLGMDRFINRAGVFLLKPLIWDRFMSVQKDTFLKPSVLQALQEEVTWDALREVSSTALNLPTLADDDEVLASFTYAALFMLDDDDLIYRWAQRMIDDKKDADGRVLADIVSYGLYTYLHARLRATESHSANANAATARAIEIKRLQSELQELRNQYDQDVKVLLDVIDQMDQKTRLQPQPGQVAAAKSPLVGKRLLVVGDESRAPAYRTILENVGAKYDFLPGFDKDHSTESKFAAADGIIFITAYSNHLKFYALRANAAHKACVLVPHAGLGEFTRRLDELATKLGHN